MPDQRRQRSDPDLMAIYLQQMASYELLSKEDEIELAQAVERGQDARGELEGNRRMAVDRRVELERLVASGDEAATKFVQANLRLVVSIAKRHQHSGVPLLDLIQEGNLGLLHAVERFNWRKGFRFSTYATWWVKQAISAGIASSGWTVRLPVDAVARMNQVRTTAAWLEARMGRSPTLAEVAQELGVDSAKLQETAPFSVRAVPLSGAQADADTDLVTVLADPRGVDALDAVVEAAVSGEVHHLLQHLDGRERQILRLRFGLDRGEPRTLREVGEIMGLTSVRVRQLQCRALGKLRHPSVVNAAHDLLAS